ncbi:MAG TPA: metallophosphoesterase family protein [Candidatus Limnocylindrales bacterium]|nr:metallophosphoesterase family protein [Candidatus Limnocylindrales bacterium]
MKIAIVSDVHGNLTALEAVVADLKQQSPDLVLHGGDLVFGGANPAEVVDAIAAEGWPGVLGNTDEMLWKPELLESRIAAAPKLEPMLRVFFTEMAPVTTKWLGEGRMQWLRKLPLEYRQRDMVLLHAGPGDLWKSPMDDADDESLRATYGSMDAKLVVYCHIHRPFVRRVGEMTVCNCGSVGAPYDGDPRASYLLINGDLPSIRRIQYDLKKETERLSRSGYPFNKWIDEMRRQGVYVPLPQMTPAQN